MNNYIFRAASAVVSGAMMMLCSCSGTLEEPEHIEDNDGMHSCEMVFDCSYPAFDAGSRADDRGNWENGDVVYLHFELDGGKTTYGNAVYNSSTAGWTVNYNGRLTTGKTMKCSVYYFKGGGFSVNDMKSQITTKPGTAVYGSEEANYLMEKNELSISASLKPMTSRIRFTGSGAYNFQLRGIQTITGVDMENMTISYATSGDLDEDPITTRTNEYIYGTFHDTELRIKRDNYVYIYEMPENHDGFMAVGASGYMTCPLPDAHNGWSMYAYNHDYKNISTSSYSSNSNSNFSINATDGDVLYFYPDPDYFFGNYEYSGPFFELSLTDPSGKKTTYSTKEIGVDNYMVIVPLSKGTWRVDYRGYYWNSNGSYNRCYYGNF